MAKSWLVDGRTIARKIKSSGIHSLIQIKDTTWECPKCSFRIYNCDVSNKWFGLPIGVKFDPSDVELLDHLAAKCGFGNEKPNEYIEEFIPTLDVDQGICYKHPENLPGSRKDGNSFHFFYRVTNAYNKGQRKRRKIYTESSSTTYVRWHKTGKTKAIFKNKVQIGFKKIMVLYNGAIGGSKPCKMNWIMHQYHLGTNEDEKDGEYVVSKIFFQSQKEAKNTCDRVVIEESESNTSLTSPMTPMTDAHNPPRAGKTPLYEDTSCDYVLESLQQESECYDYEQKYFSTITELNEPPCNDDSQITNLYLENSDLGSPPEFTLADLYFPPEDSLSGSLDWL